jgi:hypothetical protein
MGLIVDFKDNLMTWDNVVIAMKMYPKKPPLPNEPSIVSQMILNLIEDDLITTDECLSSNILQSKYEPSNIRQITQGQKQLTPSQRDELEEILLKFPKLFSRGGLGKFNGEKIHLNLDPTVPSVASRAHAVPEERHKHIFKQELDLPHSRRCSRTRHSIRMDCGNFHHTQERRTCPLGIQFSRS